MSVTLEFRYTAQDMPEAFAVLRKHIRRHRNPRHNFKRLATWLFFVTLATVYVIIISRRGTGTVAPAPPPTTPPADNWRDLIVPLLPWLAVYLVAFVGVYLLLVGMRRRVIRKMTALEDLRTVFANDDGLIWTEPAMKTEYRWNAFHGFAETPNLFVLFQGDARSGRLVRMLVVPRRAFGSPEMLSEFAALLRNHVQGHSGGFPVTPVMASKLKDTRI